MQELIYFLPCITHDQPPYTGTCILLLFMGVIVILGVHTIHLIYECVEFFLGLGAIFLLLVFTNPLFRTLPHLHHD